MDFELQPTNSKTNKINIIDDTEHNIINHESNNNIVVPAPVLTDYSQNTHQVIDMNKQPLKFNNEWMIKDVPYTEPNETEKKLLEGTKTAKELLEEEDKEKNITIEKTEKEKLEEYKKTYITKVKVLALYKCKFNPVSNPSDFSQTDKQRVIDKMQKIIKNYSEDELTEEFNKIVNTIIMDFKTKYETLPIARK
jgi:hypothetical protein